MTRPYSEKLTEHYPDAQWSMNNEEYETLEWLSDTPKPTQTELDELG